MAGIPETFTKLSPTLANYNFVDIVAGTGYINFYAGNTVDIKLLSNYTYYSDRIIDTVSITNVPAYTLEFDYDFDAVLNRPLDIKGLGIINVPLGLTCASTAGSAYVECYVRKWDGVTETEIASNTSSVFTGSNGASAYKMFGVDVTIPLTHFKKGETLRLTLMIYAKTPSGAYNVIINLGNDPKSRTTGFDSTSAVPSSLIFQCPVRLNI